MRPGTFCLLHPFQVSSPLSLTGRTPNALHTLAAPLPAQAASERTPKEASNLLFLKDVCRHPEGQRPEARHQPRQPRQPRKSGWTRGTGCVHACGSLPLVRLSLAGQKLVGWQSPSLKMLAFFIVP